MSKWVDADALPRHGKRGGLVHWKDITEAPSIDIVRCGECKRWRTRYFKDGHGWCEWHINETNADDFCSYGEREGE